MLLEPSQLDFSRFFGNGAYTGLASSRVLSKHAKPRLLSALGAPRVWSLLKEVSKLMNHALIRGFFLNTLGSNHPYYNIFFAVVAAKGMAAFFHRQGLCSNVENNVLDVGCCTLPSRGGVRMSCLSVWNSSSATGLPVFPGWM